MKEQMWNVHDRRIPGRQTTAPFLAKDRRAEMPLSPALLAGMHAYWRAANYLSVGQIYLYDNPLLKVR